MAKGFTDSTFSELLSHLLQEGDSGKYFSAPDLVNVLPVTRLHCGVEMFKDAVENSPGVPAAEYPLFYGKIREDILDYNC